jgi:hypothetical protein
MELVIICVLAYFCIGAAILLRELYLYPEDEADLSDLVSASLVCVMLWPFFLIWLLREWWCDR